MRPSGTGVPMGAGRRPATGVGVGRRSTAARSEACSTAAITRDGRGLWGFQRGGAPLAGGAGGRAGPRPGGAGAARPASGAGVGTAPRTPPEGSVPDGTAGCHARAAVGGGPGQRHGRCRAGRAVTPAGRGMRPWGDGVSRRPTAARSEACSTAAIARDGRGLWGFQRGGAPLAGGAGGRAGPRPGGAGAARPASGAGVGTAPRTPPEGSVPDGTAGYHARAAVGGGPGQRHGRCRAGRAVTPAGRCGHGAAGRPRGAGRPGHPITRSPFTHGRLAAISAAVRYQCSRSTSGQLCARPPRSARVAASPIQARASRALRRR